VLHIANIFTLGFNLGCAFAPTTRALIGLRFLSEPAIDWLHLISLLIYFTQPDFPEVHLWPLGWGPFATYFLKRTEPLPWLFYQ